MIVLPIDMKALAAEFPRDAVSWRAQTLSKAGDKALALAYIDARDVMRRLDEVCGPENWEDHYEETARGRVIATIRIRIGDGWVSKSDGAGDTAVEAEKGGISDAFKRAAVKWGIGRYLYDLPAPWVPCDTYEAGGKKHWSKWTADPWTCVRGIAPAPDEKPKAESRETFDRLSKANRACADLDAFNKLWGHEATRKAFASLPADWKRRLDDERRDKEAELHERAGIQGDGYIPPQFDTMKAAAE